MAHPNPPPDRFQREIEDVIRLAERRLERQSPRERARRQLRGVRRTLSGFSGMPGVPPPEVMAGWALALLLLSWLVGLLVSFIRIPLGGLLTLGMQVAGIALLVAALILSLTRGHGTGKEKLWRGERISYGSSYGGSDVVSRLRRFLSGRRS